MEKGSSYIITMGIGAGLISVLYFFSLTISLPFIVILPIVGFAIALLVKYLIPNEQPQENGRFQAASWAILISGVAVLVYCSYPLGTTYGNWDARAMWNLHAKYLMSGAIWQRLFLNTALSHTDYPLLVPGAIAFFAKLFDAAHVETVSFIFHFSITLFIPVLIYLQCAKKNIAVAGIALFLMATDKHYLNEGLSMYADTAVAFYLLCALVAVNNSAADKKWTIVAGMCLGCCVWTKNEGMIPAVILIAFHYKELLLRGSFKYFLGGIALPLLALFVFKTFYAPTNDMVGSLSAKSFDQLIDAGRYETVWKFFSDNVNANFLYVAIGAAVYLLVCAIERRWPGKQFLVLICCLVAYFMVYIMTLLTLEWHLGTSQNRLLHQLSPAFFYVICERLSTSVNTYLASRGKPKGQRR